MDDKIKSLKKEVARWISRAQSTNSKASELEVIMTIYHSIHDYSNIYTHIHRLVEAKELAGLHERTIRDMMTCVERSNYMPIYNESASVEALNRVFVNELFFNNQSYKNEG